MRTAATDRSTTAIDTAANDCSHSRFGRRARKGPEHAENCRCLIQSVREGSVLRLLPTAFAALFSSISAYTPAVRRLEVGWARQARDVTQSLVRRGVVLAVFASVVLEPAGGASADEYYSKLGYSANDVDRYHTVAMTVGSCRLAYALDSHDLHRVNVKLAPRLAELYGQCRKAWRRVMSRYVCCASTIHFSGRSASRLA